MREVKPNILVLVPYKIYPTSMGGQKGIALFYTYLSKIIPLSIVLSKNNETEMNEDISFYPVLGNSILRFIDPFIFFKIKNIVRKNKSTHIVLEHAYYGWVAILIRMFCKIKIIVHSHNIDSIRFKSTGKWWWRIFWNYEKCIHQKADFSFFIQDEDRKYAIENYKLDFKKCITITYGTENKKTPSFFSKQISKDIICNRHKIRKEEKIILFNGSLDYKPNIVALDIILNKINPPLFAKDNFRYKIIICGNNLPEKYRSLNNYKCKNIIYAGFVEDIASYFMGADLLINPVNDGGGIKTKVVEALGFGLSVVSTRTGSIGIPLEITGDKLMMVVDNDWGNFVNLIITSTTKNTTPDSFYEHFYWKNIVAKAAKAIFSDSV